MARRVTSFLTKPRAWPSITGGSWAEHVTTDGNLHFLPPTPSLLSESPSFFPFIQRDERPGEGLSFSVAHALERSVALLQPREPIPAARSWPRQRRVSPLPPASLSVAAMHHDERALREATRHARVPAGGRLPSDSVTADVATTSGDMPSFNHRSAQLVQRQMRHGEPLFPHSSIAQSLQNAKAGQR